MDPRARLVGKRRAVVVVQLAEGGGVLRVEDHDEREGVVRHEAGGAAGAVATREDVAGPHE